MAEKVKRLKREFVYQGAIINVYKDTVEVPGGKIESWDYIHHDGAATVVPITDDGKVIMVRQYRNALDRETLELPAGKLDFPEERTMECARRELEEETGYRSDDLEWLVTIRTWVAFCDEKIDVYVAKNLIPSNQNLDEGESIDIEIYSVDELKQKIFAGEIEDSKTMASILAFDAKYRK